MAYQLQTFINDVRSTLRDNDSRVGRERIRDQLQVALTDEVFLQECFKANPDQPRRVVHEDDELGFCVCVHVYPDAARGKPHDHGPTWAIYGQAEGETEMTDWQIVKPAENSSPTQVTLTKSYVMRPGDAHIYDPGDVHAPLRDGPTRLVRIEGENCDRITRTPIVAADQGAA